VHLCSSILATTGQGTGSPKSFSPPHRIPTGDSTHGGARCAFHRSNRSPLDRGEEALKTDKCLSVIVACYRDAKSVRECYRRLSEVLADLTPHYEIIYVNDASPDDAEEILAGDCLSRPPICGG